MIVEMDAIVRLESQLEETEGVGILHCHIYDMEFKIFDKNIVTKYEISIPYFNLPSAWCFLMCFLSYLPKMWQNHIDYYPIVFSYLSLTCFRLMPFNHKFFSKTYAECQIWRWVIFFMNAHLIISAYNMLTNPLYNSIYTKCFHDK